MPKLGRGGGTCQGIGVRAFAGGGGCARGVCGDACIEVGARASARVRGGGGCARGGGVCRYLEGGGGVQYQRKVSKLNPGSHILVPGGHATAPCAPAPRLNPAWRPVRRSRLLRVGPRRPGAGPSPAPAPAPRSARRAAPLLCQLQAPGQPGRDRAPQCPAAGCLGLGAGRPGGGLPPWEPWLRDRGRQRRPGGGGGQLGGGGAGGRAEKAQSSGGRRLPASAARPGPARMRVTSAPSARPPREAGPAE